MMGFTVPKARNTLAIAVGLLCAAQLADGTARADAPDGGMETHHGSSLITIDNSNADSWLEVDRTLNVLGPLSKGTAGSDHDGGGGAIEQHLSRSDGRVQAAPVERGEGDEQEGEGPGEGQRHGQEQGQGVGQGAGRAAGKESAANGGDDPEGDADHGAEHGAGHGADHGASPSARPAPGPAPEADRSAPRPTNQCAPRTPSPREGGPACP
ncbi:hypothetical protein ACFU99_34195 [Streptomyces sp. NPDC057654]|uniref:hypothetical protein n=1 Tax=Streptomyces sp. NPDC057654 TaxID=3346196 RepID=UPI003680429E